MPRERGKSELCEVRDSEIHGRGVYATQDIPEATLIIEYVGELIDKEESARRCVKQCELAEKSGDGAVFIFSLDETRDIDGNFAWNTARLINHSCDPNCQAWIEGERIFIYSRRPVAKGEELTFDYGFDISCYADHPCRCGKPGCVGYIVSLSQRDELRERLIVAADLWMLEGETKTG
jgi:hypothetical protein